MQIGALMDTAGVGLATFQDSGWVPQGRAPRSEHVGSAALESIGRDIVAAESLPEFEKLQGALRRAQRAEVRYAIDHPELGRRWLLTRVEPATLASGKRTTSVVTLDITEQHQSQLRGEQLLHELSTILESTTAGIAYLRGDALQRCNRRFELMLGWPEGAALGLGVQALFAHKIGALRMDHRSASAAYRANSKLAFYADVTQADCDAMANLLTPDVPVAPFATPIATTVARWGSVERHYIRCSQDRAILPALQQRFINEADAFVPGNRTVVHDLVSSHSPFLSQPSRLADLLATIAASCVAAPARPQHRTGGDTP